MSPKGAAGIVAWPGLRAIFAWSHAASLRSGQEAKRDCVLSQTLREANAEQDPDAGFPYALSRAVLWLLKVYKWLTHKVPE